MNSTQNDEFVLLHNDFGMNLYGFAKLTADKLKKISKNLKSLPTLPDTSCQNVDKNVKTAETKLLWQNSRKDYDNNTATENNVKW